VIYNGIHINEGKLLADNIIFTLILLLTIAIAAFAFLTYRNSENKKMKDRIKRLKAMAKIDTNVNRQLKKLERKQKKQKNHSLLEKALIFSLLFALILINLFVAVIPGWTDYVKKDYVVYGGDLDLEYTVHRYIKSSTITLEDGTVLSGIFGLDEGKHFETIVYSKRTKIVLGIDK